MRVQNHATSGAREPAAEAVLAGPRMPDTLEEKERAGNEAGSEGRNKRTGRDANARYERSRKLDYSRADTNAHAGDDGVL